MKGVIVIIIILNCHKTKFSGLNHCKGYVSRINVFISFASFYEFKTNIYLHLFFHASFNS